MDSFGEGSSSDTMKFLVDMALSPKTVEVLRSSGYEAVRVNELGMAKSRDREILEDAAKNDMIVITADLDFGDILAFTRYKKPSVIIFRLKNPSPDRVNSLLLSAIPHIKDSLDKGSIIVIDDYRIRIRELPVL
jgi:predicted nuclease of predicted toxin-antitoxin system